MKIKKPLLIACLSVLCFFCGWLAGHEGTQKLASVPSNPRTEDSGMDSIDQIVNAATIEDNIIRLLSTGKVDDGKHMLLLEEDCHILEMNELMVSAGAYSQKRATNLLSTIGRRRDSMPFNYNGQLTKEEVNTFLTISNILGKYK